MKGKLVKTWVLYKHRYLLGYGLLGVILLHVTTWRFWLVPNGLSEVEMATATVSGGFSWSALLSGAGEIVNAPWTILQWLSIQIFGFSTFALRLPAAVLAIATGVALILAFRKWSRANISIVAGLIALTSVMFIGLARSGSAAVMTVFLVSIILLGALEVLTADKSSQIRTLIWKIASVVALALLLYTPSGVYVVAMLVIVGVLHPKVRLIFLRTRLWKIVIGAGVGLIVLLPLILNLILHFNSSVAAELLALNGMWSVENLKSLAVAAIGLNADFVAGWLAPSLTIVDLCLALIGLFRVCTSILAARSYLVLPMLAIGLILATHDPALIYLLFVPFMLLIAVGVETLIGSWYGLFPNNPYARVFALLPLTILIVGLSLTSIARYFSANNYSAAVVYSYNQEFEVARSEIIRNKDIAATLVVSPNGYSFYKNMEKNFPKLKVAVFGADTLSCSETEETGVKTETQTLVLASAGEMRCRKMPNRIITNSHTKNAVLLRVY